MGDARFTQKWNSYTTWNDQKCGRRFIWNCFGCFWPWFFESSICRLFSNYYIGIFGNIYCSWDKTWRTKLDIVLECFQKRIVDADIDYFHYLCIHQLHYPIYLFEKTSGKMVVLIVIKVVLPNASHILGPRCFDHIPMEI